MLIVARSVRRPSKKARNWASAIVVPGSWTSIWGWTSHFWMSKKSMRGNPPMSMERLQHSSLCQSQEDYEGEPSPEHGEVIALITVPKPSSVEPIAMSNPPQVTPATIDPKAKVKS